jgi:hypothetical protein
MKLPFGQTLQSKIRGLKCDRPGCGWSDMTIPYKEYPKWLDCPCPKCGASVLTKADYATCRQVKRLELAVNVLAFPFAVIRDTLGAIRYCTTLGRKGDESEGVRLRMNGTGHVGIEAIRPGQIRPKN